MSDAAALIVATAALEATGAGTHLPRVVEGLLGGHAIEPLGLLVRDLNDVGLGQELLRGKAKKRVNFCEGPTEPLDSMDGRKGVRAGGKGHLDDGLGAVGVGPEHGAPVGVDHHH